MAAILKRKKIYSQTNREKRKKEQNEQATILQRSRTKRKERNTNSLTHKSTDRRKK